LKVITTTHKDVGYEFRYLESSEVVQIIKFDGGLGSLYYLMFRDRNRGQFVCNCPGSRYHRHCWHTSMIAPLLKQPSIISFWADLAEEAGTMMYSR